MNNLRLKKGICTPYICLNKDTGTFEIEGDSCMEHPVRFYNPIIAWLDEAVKPNQSIRFDFCLGYYNADSSRMFLSIFSLLEEKAARVNINWYTKPNDSNRMEEGESFQEDFPGFNFNIIVKRRIAG